MFHLILKNLSETNETRPISEIIRQRPAVVAHLGGWLAAGICIVVLLFLYSIRYEPVVLVRADMVIPEGDQNVASNSKSVFRIPLQKATSLKNGMVVYFHSDQYGADSLKKGAVDSIITHAADSSLLVRIVWQDATPISPAWVGCNPRLSYAAKKEPVLFKFLRQSFR